MIDAPVTIYQGANDPPVIWRFKEPDGTASDLPERFICTVDPSASPKFILDSDRGELDIDHDAGEVRWVPDASFSAAIHTGTGSYELIGDDDGLVRPWAGGEFTVESYL